MRGSFALAGVLVATACARPASDPPAHPPFLAAAPSTPAPPPPDPDHDAEAAPQIADECPDEPGRSARNPGCSDDDDVLAADRCPDVPETLNDFEDADGCPDADPPHIVQLRALFAQIQFQDSKKKRTAVQLTAAATRALHDVADLLLAHPGLHLRIAVHVAAADERLYARVGLSRTRAAVLRQQLAILGVDLGRIETVGYGDSVPRTSDATKAGLALNRRVEFTVVKPSPSTALDIPQ